MREGTGRPVFSGVAIGKAYVYFPRQSELPASCGDSEIELKNFNAARETARSSSRRSLRRPAGRSARNRP